MTNLLLIIEFVVCGFLLVKIFKYQKKIDWMEKTYDRNFRFVQGILNNINNKIDNTADLLGENDDEIRLLTPDEYHEIFDRIESLEKILTHKKG